MKWSIRRKQTRDGLDQFAAPWRSAGRAFGNQRCREGAPELNLLGAPTAIDQYLTCMTSPPKGWVAPGRCGAK